MRTKDIGKSTDHWTMHVLIVPSTGMFYFHFQLVHCVLDIRITRMCNKNTGLLCAVWSYNPPASVLLKTVLKIRKRLLFNDLLHTNAIES